MQLDLFLKDSIQLHYKRKNKKKKILCQVALRYRSFKKFGSIHHSTGWYRKKKKRYWFRHLKWQTCHYNNTEWWCMSLKEAVAWHVFQLFGCTEYNSGISFKYCKTNGMPIKFNKMSQKCRWQEKKKKNCIQFTMSPPSATGGSSITRNIETKRAGTCILLTSPHLSKCGRYKNLILTVYREANIILQAALPV